MYARFFGAAVLFLVPTAASANCPSTMDLTTRLNCLNRSLNTAATTITSLQTALDAANAANAALDTRVDDLDTEVGLQEGDIADLLTASASTDAAVSSLQGDVDDLTKSLDTLGVIDVGDLFTYLTVDTSTNSVIFSGANVYVQSGSGQTNGTLNGLGNLIVGYDEDAIALGAATASDRTGSHNLVVGMGHSYQSYGGFVAGLGNTLSGPDASVTGGDSNTASGVHSVVVGGSSNIASGWSTAILGGNFNDATGTWASVSGGNTNGADGSSSSILGGYAQTTSDAYETVPTNDVADVGDLFTYLTVDTATNSVIFSGANVYVQSGSGATDGALNGLGNLIIGYDETPAELGYGAYVGSDRGGSHNIVVGMGHSYTSYGGFVDGVFNTLQGSGASVCGGILNVASGTSSSVAGGVFNQAIGDYSAVAGGYTNKAIGQWSSVLGGSTNSAGASGATVSGGIYNLADGVYSAILGGAFQSTSEDNETFPQ